MRTNPLFRVLVAATRLASRGHRTPERGAVLVHTAIAMVALIAFNGLVIDYGILWLARRQAQNSADAAAMAGAISLGLVDFDDKDLAKTSALNTAAQNLIWGETPDITDADVTFPPCPPGSPGAGSDACIRVDVYRNQTGGPASVTPKPLPTFFGNLFAVTEQGVKATATAEVLWGAAADCVKPFAIPDKWLEKNPVDVPVDEFWDEPRSFEAYEQTGNNKGAKLVPADLYEPPQSLQPPGVINTTGPAGTGFTPTSVVSGGGDYGRLITLKNGNPQDAIAPGWYFPVVINPSEGPGGDNYRDNIATCDSTRIQPGDLLDTEPGNMVGPTQQGIQILMDNENAGAVWDTTLNAPVGCKSSDPITGICVKSSRIVAIPVFNPDEYDSGRASGRQVIQITKVIGFWIEGISGGGDVTGRVMFYPTEWNEGDDINKEAAFVISIALVR
jgi:Putative Flp pilus-assembly TadE/G-like